MNQRIKFLELVLSDLVSDRDTSEMDLNFILNNDEKKTKNKKKEFNNVLKGIVNVNNKIKTLSEYITVLTPQEEFVNNIKDSQ